MKKIKMAAKNSKWPPKIQNGHHRQIYSTFSLICANALISNKKDRMITTMIEYYIISLLRLSIIVLKLSLTTSEGIDNSENYVEIMKYFILRCPVSRANYRLNPF